MTSKKEAHVYDAGLGLDDEPFRWPEAPSFVEVAARRASRREILRGSLAAAVAGMFGATASAQQQGSASVVPPGLDRGRSHPSLLGFMAVPTSGLDAVVVPEGYSYQVLLPWGSPISGDYPEFSLSNSGEDQGNQMGMHHDGMHFFPLSPGNGRGDLPAFAAGGSSDDGLLVMNHEYIEPRLMHAEAAGLATGSLSVLFGADGFRDTDQVRKETNGHGVSVVHVQKHNDGTWQMVPDARNRRITALTPMEIAGPVRGHDSVKTKYSPDGTRTRGTLNNCAHGVTPWNTYLACEENIWYYFTNTQYASAPPSMTNYLTGWINFFAWHRARSGDDEFVRFEVTPTAASATEDYRNEPHCFGWVVEIDPFDPSSVPVKRTALGRFSHEGAVFGPAREGKPIVVYSGDDRAGAYIYKFVSARNYHRTTADGSLLDEGTLYAARFYEDGTGEWLALAPGENGLTAENGFPDLASILVNTRGAGQLAGATPMDRPEWGTVDPLTGAVYFSCTNNGSRPAPGPANPRAFNIYGHIVRWWEDGRDQAATSFTWDIFALGGTEEHGVDGKGDALTPDNIFGSPDGLWMDPDGRLWIQTDAADAITSDYQEIGNNMMLAADPNTGEIRRFLTGPNGCEITGVITTPDQRTMFVNVQHPGAGTSSANFAAGNLQSHWPEGGDAYPRSATLVITKNDGGKIGT
jgi:uncharacterized protein